MLRRKQNLSDALVDDIRNKEEAARDAKAFETSRSVAASRKRAEALLDEIADEIPRVVQHCAENGPEPHVFTVIVVKDSVFGSKIRRVEKAGWTVLSYTQTDLAPKYESSANLQRQWKITADGWLVYPGQGRMTKIGRAHV